MPAAVVSSSGGLVAQHHLLQSRNYRKLQMHASLRELGALVDCRVMRNVGELGSYSSSLPQTMIGVEVRQ